MPRYQVSCLFYSDDTRQELSIRLSINKQMQS